MELEEKTTVYETITARAAARLFLCTVEEFYTLSIDSGICIREVPERPSIKYREYCLERRKYFKNEPIEEWEPWYYIAPSKIVYRLEDVVNTYYTLYGREPKLPKQRIKRVAATGEVIDRVTATIDELIASGRLSEQWQARPSSSEWSALRKFVFDRDDHTCQYCSKQGSNLHCDHIIPISRGGSNHPDNLVTACGTCNLQKHAKTPEEWLS